MTTRCNHIFGLVRNSRDFRTRASSYRLLIHGNFYIRRFYNNQQDKKVKGIVDEDESIHSLTNRINARHADLKFFNRFLNSAEYLKQPINNLIPKFKRTSTAKSSRKFPSFNLPFRKKKKPPLGTRIKTFLVRGTIKIIIAGAIVYASYHYRVWGEVNESVELWSRIRSQVYKRKYELEPIDSDEVAAAIVTTYNENVKSITCKLISLPKIIFCYTDKIVLYAWEEVMVAWEWMKDKWKGREE